MHLVAYFHGDYNPIKLTITYCNKDLKKKRVWCCLAWTWTCYMHRPSVYTSWVLILEVCTTVSNLQSAGDWIEASCAVGKHSTSSAPPLAPAHGSDIYKKWRSFFQVLGIHFFTHSSLITYYGSGTILRTGDPMECELPDLIKLIPEQKTQITKKKIRHKFRLLKWWKTRKDRVKPAS